MSVYESLGIRRVINADARLTRLGGSLMPEPVLAAMREAAQSYVDIFELQQVVGQRIAALTHNEAAYVCTGASAGLFLAGLACIGGGDVRALVHWPNVSDRNELIIHRTHRFPYDPALQLSGGRLVEIGNVWQTFAWELEAAITPRTAGIVYVAGDHLQRGVLPIEETIRVAHAYGLPVIVDAAAQLPPPENLWHFTRDLGADLAIFSGGKELRGPQASGLLLGRADLIAACTANGAPHQRFGRPMKVGKEEMVGLLAALELYLAQDHGAHLARCEQIVSDWTRTLVGLRGVVARRDFPNEAGRPVPRLLIEIDAQQTGICAADLRARLWDGTPRVAVAYEGNRLYMTPDTLEPGEPQMVVDLVLELLRASSKMLDD